MNVFVLLSLSLQLERVQRSSKDDHDGGKTDLMLVYSVSVIERTYFLIAIIILNVMTAVLLHFFSLSNHVTGLSRFTGINLFVSE